jgi:hypothetical protein
MIGTALLTEFGGYCPLADQKSGQYIFGGFPHYINTIKTILYINIIYKYIIYNIAYKLLYLVEVTSLTTYFCISHVRKNFFSKKFFEIYFAIFSVKEWSFGQLRRKYMI